jgi:hypothetical protein
MEHITEKIQARMTLEANIEAALWDLIVANTVNFVPVKGQTNIRYINDEIVYTAFFNGTAYDVVLN